MKIGIVCASDQELAPFLPPITECRVSEKAMLKFYEGKIRGLSRQKLHITMLPLIF